MAGLPAGSGRVELPGVAPDGAPMPLWFHRPAGSTAGRPVVFVLHGLNRDADKYRDNWVALADQHRLLILTPEFSQAQFPGSERYNFGDMVDARGALRDRARWSFGAIERVFDAVRAMGGLERDGYVIFGHSAGAQFTHRALLFGALERAELVISANAGAYIRLDPSIPFIGGLKGAPIDEAGERRAYRQRAIFMLGDADTDPNHPNLPRGRFELDEQGPHRFARGRYFLRSAEARAMLLGGTLAWRQVVVPGVAHDNAGMARAAAPLIAAEVA
jgi:hypothetical protein